MREWGLAPDGQCQAQEYYEAMSLTDRARASALFVRMADLGRLYDNTKFNQETKKLYVFKPQPHRFFCFFVKGKRILIVSAYRKQGQKAPQSGIKRAEAIRTYLERLFEKEERSGKK